MIIIIIVIMFEEIETEYSLLYRSDRFLSNGDIRATHHSTVNYKPDMLVRNPIVSDKHD